MALHVVLHATAHATSYSGVKRAADAHASNDATCPKCQHVAARDPFDCVLPMVLDCLGMLDSVALRRVSSECRMAVAQHTWDDMVEIANRRNMAGWRASFPRVRRVYTHFVPTTLDFPRGSVALTHVHLKGLDEPPSWLPLPLLQCHTLTFELCKLGDTALCTLVPRFPNLVYLSVQSCSFYAAGGISQCDVLTTAAPKLTHLTLCDCGIVDAGLAMLATNLVCMPNLEHLDVSHNRFGDEGVCALAAHLAYTPRLGNLQLQYNTSALPAPSYSLSQAGVRALVSALMHAPAMQFVKLSVCAYHSNALLVDVKVWSRQTWSAASWQQRTILGTTVHATLYVGSE